VNVWECDLVLDDGAVLHVHDTAEGDVTVLWHHGTPNIGTPPAPLAALSAELGVRWVSWDRPGYGTSTPRPGRDVATAASYGEQVLDALHLDHALVLGHSGGGPHALACAALLPDRVRGAAVLAGLAPYPADGPEVAADADGFDWFDAMAASGVAALGAAAQSREARARWEHEAGDTYDPEFTATDLATLEGEWGWFGSVVGPAVAQGPDPAIDDDVAYASPWGFDPGAVACPVLLVHGGADRVVPPAHARHLSHRLPHAELWEVPGAGHLAVVERAADALRWLVERA
jgi:pimeloyl-ACP methyl ester carboxylesterase